MFKKALLALLTLLILLAFTTAASAGISEKNVILVLGAREAQIDGQTVVMSAPAQLIDGRTLVPLRFISEAFSCDVDWNGNLRTATVKLVDHTIEVPLGQNYAVIDGHRTEVQVPAQLINGSTYVPLRFISEGFGAKVDYDANNRAIAISLRTYTNTEQGFKMVLPVDWEIDEETPEEVSLYLNESCGFFICLIDSGSEINASNFPIYAEECFRELSTEQELIATEIDGLMAIMNFKEVEDMEEWLGIMTLKALDNGVFFCLFATTEEQFDSYQGQNNIMTYSLVSMTSE